MKKKQAGKLDYRPVFLARATGFLPVFAEQFEVATRFNAGRALVGRGASLVEIAAVDAFPGHLGGPAEHLGRTDIGGQFAEQFFMMPFGDTDCVKGVRRSA